MSLSLDSLKLVLGGLLVFDIIYVRFSLASSVTGTAHVITAYQASGSSRTSCWWACYGKLNYSFSVVDMTCRHSAPSRGGFLKCGQFHFSHHLL